MIKNKNQVKIHLHDFGGYNFPAELSNELSLHNYKILHTHFPHTGFDKGIFTDINNTGKITFKSIKLKQSYRTQNLFIRLLFEFKLAFKLLMIHIKFHPQVVILTNVPLITALIYRLVAQRASFILWHQDIFSGAILMRNSKNNNSVLSKVQNKTVIYVEKYLVRSVDQVICVADTFTDIYRAWNINPNKVHIIENWAPLYPLHKEERENKSSKPLKFIYTGTLGMKHNPELLLDFVDQVSRVGIEVRLTIISEGYGAEYLKSNFKLNKMIQIRNFVPLDQLKQMLAESDIAIMLLEESASEFSVPSKTYTYLAAGKPILAFAPENNLASKSILDAGGAVFFPNSQGVETSVHWISSMTQKKLEILGDQARAFAEANFSIKGKAEEFIRIISASVRP